MSDTTFKRFIAPLRRIKWVVYCKAPFAGPKQVLRYLSRYTHRVAISNRRLIAADDAGVAFRWKDTRIDGPGRWKTMRLHPHEFIRRFLMHVLPRGFHRIRHYGLFANANRAENIAKARALLGADAACRRPAAGGRTGRAARRRPPCPHCGARMIVIEVFARGCEPRSAPTPGRFDTSLARLPPRPAASPLWCAGSPPAAVPLRPFQAILQPAPVDTVQPPRRDASSTLSRPAARKLAGRVARRRTSIECAANLKSP